jgi:dTMP kinase
MRFLVIEGLDGSGKSTQVDRLRHYLNERGTAFRYLHFPRLEEGVYGKLIARFLRGEMGDINHVDPYLVALIFAGDRNDAKEMIETWIGQEELVLVDRYVYSNIAFQCAKLTTASEREALTDWIAELEFGYHRLPVPDMNVFLDVPFEFTQRQLSVSRAGQDRDYLKGGQDIHERDLAFQEQVRAVYLSLTKRFDNIRVVECGDERGNMLPPEKVFDKLISITGL